MRRSGLRLGDLLAQRQTDQQVELGIVQAALDPAGHQATRVEEEEPGLAGKICAGNDGKHEVGGVYFFSDRKSSQGGVVYSRNYSDPTSSCR